MHSVLIGFRAWLNNNLWLPLVHGDNGENHAANGIKEVGGLVAGAFAMYPCARNRFW